MHHVWNIILKGIAAVLPVGLTLYLVFWLGISIERWLQPVITSSIIPEHYYLPGMGLATGFLLLFFIGLAVNALIVRRLFQLGEELLEHIPLIKSVYGALRDFTEYFAAARERNDMQQVVLVKVGEIRLIGFLTSENVGELPSSEPLDGVVAVYIPLSYQIGGYTVYIPKSSIEVLDMRFEEAMRHVLTAGLSKSGNIKKERTSRRS